MNRLRWYIRCPLKVFLFFLGTLVVCFPYPSLVAAHLRHWRAPDALIDGDSEAIQPLLRELRDQVPPDTPPAELLAAVERYVHRRVPYAYDWNVWGMADYLPTVEQVIEQGREDCDGRALVAASMLEGLGIPATIVGNFSHVWVRTAHGEAMGPQKTRVVVATPEGVRFQASGLLNVPRALAFGIAVFPLTREVIILVLLWLLHLRRGQGPVRLALSLSVMGLALVLVRTGSADYAQPVVWQQIGALMLFFVGVGMLWFAPADKRNEAL